MVAGEVKLSRVARARAWAKAEAVEDLALLLQYFKKDSTLFPRSLSPKTRVQRRRGWLVGGGYSREGVGW